MSGRAIIAIVMIAAYALPAHGAIFARRDASGAMVYSNVPAPVRGGVIELAPAARASVPEPDKFPRIARAEQQQRDLGRQAILNQELDNEQQQLGRARAAGAAQEVQHRHQSNIDALKRELAGLH
jgi:hypothetical protein